MKADKPRLYSNEHRRKQNLADTKERKQSNRNKGVILLGHGGIASRFISNIFERKLVRVDRQVQIEKENSCCKYGEVHLSMKDSLIHEVKTGQCFYMLKTNKIMRHLIKYTEEKILHKL